MPGRTVCGTSGTAESTAPRSRPRPSVDAAARLPTRWLQPARAVGAEGGIPGEQRTACDTGEQCGATPAPSMVARRPWRICGGPCRVLAAGHMEGRPPTSCAMEKWDGTGSGETVMGACVRRRRVRWRRARLFRYQTIIQLPAPPKKPAAVAVYAWQAS